jgi:hypothetical protein
MYQYLISGLDNVFLKNGYNVTQDDQHGTCYSFIQINNLNRCIAKTLAQAPRRLSLAEITYLRKTLDMSVAQMYEALGSGCGVVPLMSVPEEAVLRMLVLEKWGLKIKMSQVIEAIKRDLPATPMYFELKSIWKRTSESNCI